MALGSEQPYEARQCCVLDMGGSVWPHITVEPGILESGSFEV